MLKSLGNIFVVGGVALDITATAVKRATFPSVLHTSTPGGLRHTLGGVGRNVCETAMRTGASAHLVSITGDDMQGKIVRQSLKDIGMSEKHIQVLPGHGTAVYNALHSGDGQLVAAIADMDIFDKMDSSEVVNTLRAERPAIVCFDGNIPTDTMGSISTLCAEMDIPVLFEPTSVPKSLKIFSDSTLATRAIRFTTPNQYELEAMSETAKTTMPATSSDDTSLLSSFDLGKVAPRSAELVLPYGLHLSQWIPNVIIKLGEDGCLFVGRSDVSNQPPVVQYFSPEKFDQTSIVSVTGAGDSFVGALLANLKYHSSLQPEDQDTWKEIITRAQRAAVLTLQSDLAVSPHINEDLLFRAS
ncbi:indigoidine synthase a-like protein [Lichtheimia corymbifera JMRC:FSU:9682]|uniref:Indigoidine synthase a-like protein n=1 Tax=Lichtheimia corymbifera JMRC:FSU:9682 TaxID=1263082 RepID=A0A068S5C6_9FUNG|nr:indigoidine synthase a-like protein [Lichtheimia corymbifera JMRC:FSU:9682]